MSTLHTKLTDLLEPVVQALGYELVMLEYMPSGGNSLLRLYIDCEAGIKLDDCEKVSREVAAVLDVEDPISAAYRLEVSSPGMDRPLAKPTHFQRFIGHAVKVQLLAPGPGGRRRYAGTITQVGPSGISLETLEGPVALEFSEIERARLVPDYEQELS